MHTRPDAFPQSIILCGVRDVRDYRINSSKHKEIITGGSCFNVKAKSIRLGNFNEKDVKFLYLQHTEETGQEFTEEALKLVYNLAEYMDRTGTNIGHLLIFDKSENKSWEEKIFRKEKEYNNKQIMIWGM